MLYKALIILTAFIVFYSCSKNDESGYVMKPEEGEYLSGGKNGTIVNNSEEAFGFFSRGLTSDQETDFGIGNSFFRQSWITAPATATARDGLGPFFNAISCASCHFKDGRGRAPEYDGELGTGLLLRLSTSQQDVHGAYLPDPVYGGQLQDVAINGVDAEAAYTISYEYITEMYPDGSSAELRKPTYNIQGYNYGDMTSDLHVSPRVANQMIGMGLLEALSESTILAAEDITDADADGISGKANYVFDRTSNTIKLGRFGWKANQPTVRQQVAGAFSGDIGLTSSIFPKETFPSGFDGSTIISGGEPEVPDTVLDRVVLYSSTLAVPARRDYDTDEVLKGKQIFNNIACAKCHTPKFTTNNSYYIEANRNQEIRPYTDLLLHDMGEGLADHAPDFLADGNEWRTQPLWGIGLISVVNGHTYLLHDGRARNIEEAILWHGGEAENAKNEFKSLSKEERDQLIAFVQSL